MKSRWPLHESGNDIVISNVCKVVMKKGDTLLLSKAAEVLKRKKNNIQMCFCVQTHVWCGTQGATLNECVKHVAYMMNSERCRLQRSWKPPVWDGLYFGCSFNSVKNGNHILFREFNYIKATPHNRASFIRIFWRCFRQIGKNGGRLHQFSWDNTDPVCVVYLLVNKNA